MSNLIGAVIAVLAGAVIAWINYRLTAKATDNRSRLYSVVPVLRQLLNVGFLAAVYLIAPLTPWDRIWLLAGAVIGLTVPMFVFTFLLLHKVNNDNTQSGSKGGSH